MVRLPAAVVARAALAAIVAFAASPLHAAAVKWEPWPSAIARAAKEQKPLFVHAGNASAWDVKRMELDAFSDARNAALLQERYVAAQVDPIDHPELARALEVLGGPAVPLNLILTPSLQPIAVAGFLSADELQNLLATTAGRWSDARADVEKEAHARLQQAWLSIADAPAAGVDDATAEAVVDAIATDYTATKTLDPIGMPFLLRYAARTRHEPIRTLTVETLRQRAASALRDQLGGGFHRCETCFDKLTADQAVNAIVYLEAWQATADPLLAHVSKTTLDYLLRDQRNPDTRLFAAAQASQSLVPDGAPVLVDGAFYVWTRGEIERIAGAFDAGKIASLYSVGEKERRRLAVSDPRHLGETYDELAAPLAKLLEERQKRPSPFRDHTVVAGWNGLVISALARAGTAFAEQRYVDAAVESARALTTRLWHAKKQTLARTDEGVPGLAEDYALVVQALLDLYETTRDVRWLESAVAVQQAQDRLFWDAKRGRYTTGASLPVSLQGLAREADALVPSANAVAARNLLRLASLMPNDTWRARPAQILASFGGELRARGAELASLAHAHELSRIAANVVVVVGEPRGRDTHELLRALDASPEPMRSIVFVPAKEAARDRVVKLLPFTAALEAGEEGAVAYRCSGGGCRRQ